MADSLRDDLGRQPADQERLLVTLLSNDVEFLVIGGVAVYVHGYVRLTRDVDIQPDPSSANLSRLAGALTELQAVAIGARGEPLALDLTHPESLALGNYFLDTKAGALDLFNGPRPDLKRYRALEARALEVPFADYTMRVISRDDLIEMKREAGRPKDLADIAALTEAERSREPEE